MNENLGNTICATGISLPGRCNLPCLRRCLPLNLPVDQIGTVGKMSRLPRYWGQSCSRIMALIEPVVVGHVRTVRAAYIHMQPSMGTCDLFTRDQRSDFQPCAAKSARDHTLRERLSVDRQR